MARCEPVGAFGEGRLLPILYCDYCDSAEHVSPRSNPWHDFAGYECERCADREPGDSHYEDTGRVRHELEDASGVWRR